MSQDDPERSAQRGSRLFLGYGVAFVVFAVVLWLSGRTPVQEPDEPHEEVSTAESTLASVNEGVETAAHAVLALVENRRHDVARTTEDSGFEPAMTRLAQRLEAQSFSTVPPAAVPMVGDPFAGFAAGGVQTSLVYSTPDGLPALEGKQSLWLELGTVDGRRRYALSGFPERAPLPDAEVGEVTIGITRNVPGGFFVAERNDLWTETRVVSLAAVLEEDPYTVSLPGRFPLQRDGENGALTLQLRLREDRFVPGFSGSEAGDAILLRGGAGDGVAQYSGSPGVSERWRQRLLVPAAGSFTYALIWQDRSTAGLAGIRRSEDGRYIGARAPGLPLYVAAVDGWGSLELALANAPQQQSAGFRVLAASGDFEAARALFLAFLSRNLVDLKLDDMPLTRAQFSEIARWLRDALGLPTDVEALVADMPPEAAATLSELLQ